MWPVTATMHFLGRLEPQYFTSYLNLISHIYSNVWQEFVCFTSSAGGSVRIVQISVATDKMNPVHVRLLEYQQLSFHARVLVGSVTL
jgi:hypothetical protein